MKEIGNADRQEVGRRAQQSRREFASAVSTTRTGHAAVSKHEDAAKIRSVHAEVHNHFNQERHLVTREVYEQSEPARWPRGAPSQPSGRFGLGVLRLA